MSEEQLKAFIAKAKEDSSIQEKLKAAKSPDDVIGIAKESGFMISADDLKNAQSHEMREISEEELEGVAGGVCDPKSRKSGAITAEAISILIGCKWL